MHILIDQLDRNNIREETKSADKWPKCFIILNKIRVCL